MQINSDSHEALLRQDSLDISLTGSSTQVTPFYFTKICYRYHCFRSTTLGPNILGAVISSCASGFNRLRKLSTFLYLCIPAQIGLMIGLQIACNNNKIDALYLEIASLVEFGLMSIMLLMNLSLWFIVSIPLELAWELGLVYFIENFEHTHTNEFVTVTYGQQIRYLNTDLRNYVFAAELRKKAKIELMFYGAQWKKSYMDRVTIWEPICLWLGYAGVAGTSPTYDDDYYTNYWLVLFGGPFLIFFVACICLCLIRIAWVVLNVLFCCIPGIILNSIRERVLKKVHSHITQSESPHLGY